MAKDKVLTIEQVNLKRRRRALGYTQEKLDEVADAGRGRTFAYENGRAKPADDYLKAVAPFLGVKDIKEFSEAMEPSVERELPTVPYWGVVPCGQWEKPGNDPETVQLEVVIPSTKGVIAVRITGASMRPLLREGMLIPIKLGSQKKDDKISLIRNADGDLTLKVTRYVRGRWEFHPLNSDYEPSTSEEVTLIGHAIAIPAIIDPEGITP